MDFFCLGAAKAVKSPFFPSQSPRYAVLHKLNLTVSLDLVMIPKPGQGGVTLKGNDNNKSKFLLTNREREVFELLVQDKTTKDIAQQLFISEKTVRNHISNVMWFEIHTKPLSGGGRRRGFKPLRPHAGTTVHSRDRITGSFSGM